MAGVGCRGFWLHVTVAVVLGLSAWVSRSMCLSLHGLGKNLQQAEVDEATVAGGQKGKILFDGKDLELQVDPSSATASGKLLKIILGQSTPSEKSEKEDFTDKDAAWKHLKPSLHCGQSQMEFRATGHRAADLQLDIGSADPLPLNQVPKSCGYTMEESPLGFFLAVSYDGCNMIREDGIYVLKMRWLNASVEFICSVASSSELPDQSEFHEPVLPSVRTWRPRRHATRHLDYDPHSLYHYYYYVCLYYYYMYMKNLERASETPDLLQVPIIEPNPYGDGDQMLHYYPYYNPYYYPDGSVPLYSECDLIADPWQKTQCSKTKPGHTKWPFYPSGKPTHPGFHGSQSLPQVHQQYYGKYPHQQLPSLKVPGKPHKPPPTAPPPTVATTRCSNPDNPIATTKAPCPNPDKPVTPTKAPCRNSDGITSCDGAVSKYVPYETLTFRPYISYEGGRSAGGRQDGADVAGRPRSPAFSGLEGYDPQQMASLVPENLWFPYYYYPAANE